MSAHPTARVLVVMDVDGTLVKNGIALRDPFYRAFREVTGKEIRGLKVDFAGRTDRGIVRDYMELVGAEGDFDTVFTAFADRYTEHVAQDYPSHPDPHMLPGVIPLLEALDTHPDVGLVLGTGNVRQSCEIKLKRFDLLKYFPHLGGFGGDHEIRVDVIRSAIDVGWTHFGELSDIWVIGDTLNDAVAAHQAGAKALLVATGIFSLAELQASDAESILPDLTDTSRVMEILGLG